MSASARRAFIRIRWAAGPCAAVLVALTTACGQGPTSPGPSPNSDRETILQVHVGALGHDIPDSFIVLVDGQYVGFTQLAFPWASVSVTPGDHLVELRIRANCRVGGENPRTVHFEAGRITTVDFGVSCLRALVGQVAFVSDRDGDTTLYTSARDYGAPERLPVRRRAGTADADPSVSPDGTQLAFRSTRDDPDGDIYVITLNDSAVTRITESAGFDGQPRWSPDGSRIAFVSERSGSRDIWVMAADGSDPADLTPNPARDELPTWAPDGAWIAFQTDRDGNAEVYVMGADGSSPTDLTGDPAYDGAPAWSPDGTSLAFASDRAGTRAIFVLDPEAGAGSARQLTFPAGGSADDRPTWGSDSYSLAFQTSRDGNWDIWSMAMDPVSFLNLSDSPADDVDPAWSPLGS